MEGRRNRWMDECMNRWTDGWIDGWFLQMCVFMSRLPSKKTYWSYFLPSASLRYLPIWLTVLLTPPLYLFLFLSIHFSPFPTFYISFILSSRLFPTFPFPSLIYYSHPSLTLPLSPLTPEIPPSAPGRLDLHQQCFPPRKRNRMMNKRTEQRDR